MDDTLARLRHRFSLVRHGLLDAIASRITSGPSSGLSGSTVGEGEECTKGEDKGQPIAERPTVGDTCMSHEGWRGALGGKVTEAEEGTADKSVVRRNASVASTRRWERDDGDIRRTGRAEMPDVLAAAALAVRQGAWTGSRCECRGVRGICWGADDVAQKQAKDDGWQNGARHGGRLLVEIGCCVEDWLSVASRKRWKRGQRVAP